MYIGIALSDFDAQVKSGLLMLQDITIIKALSRQLYSEKHWR